MSLRTPAQVARRIRRENLRRLLVRAMAELDVTQEEAADSIGTSRTVFQRICAREEDAGLRLSDVAALPPELAVQLLRWAADQIHEIHGGACYSVAMLAPPEDTTGDDIQRLAALVREHGEAAAKYAELVATNQWTARNTEDVDRELSEAISAAVAVREAVRAKLKFVRQ